MSVIIKRHLYVCGGKGLKWVIQEQVPPTLHLQVSTGVSCAALQCFLHLFCFEDPKSAQEINESLTGGGLVGKQSQAFLSHAANVSVCEVWQTVHALGG